jgi:hypothetical protein
MRKTHSFWTPREDARLAELRARGISVPAIASALGRSNASVNGRIQSCGLNGNSHVPRGEFECHLCGRVFTTPQGRGLHHRHGCPKAGDHHG